jgi:hypothetical protein
MARTKPKKDNGNGATVPYKSGSWQAADKQAKSPEPSSNRRNLLVLIVQLDPDSFH